MGGLAVLPECAEHTGGAHKLCPEMTGGPGNAAVGKAESRCRCAHGPLRTCASVETETKDG